VQGTVIVVAVIGAENGQERRVSRNCWGRWSVVVVKLHSLVL